MKSVEANAQPAGDERAANADGALTKWPVGLSSPPTGPRSGSAAQEAAAQALPAAPAQSQPAPIVQGTEDKPQKTRKTAEDIEGFVSREDASRPVRQ